MNLFNCYSVLAIFYVILRVQSSCAQKTFGSHWSNFVGGKQWLTDSDFRLAQKLTEEQLQKPGSTGIAPQDGMEFEGDILLPDRNIQSNGIRHKSRRWQNGVIPYMVAQGFSTIERAKIASAVAEFHRTTCIRFVKRTVQKDYVNIAKGSACSSYIGRKGEGSQVLSLTDSCTTKGIVLHELMHLAGFLHEQSRIDRDDYVTVKWENVKFGDRRNFEKYSHNTVDHFAVSYDYGSIMHYGRSDFSIRNGLDTIVPINPPNAKIGQRFGLSPKDILKLNRMYPCTIGTAIPTIPTVTTWDSCVDSMKLCKDYVKFGMCWNVKVKDNCKRSCDLCKVNEAKYSKQPCRNKASNIFCQMVSVRRQCHGLFAGFCDASCSVC